jgi:peroxiredoxin
MPRSDDLYQLPKGLPAPVDDGACDHLPGMDIPRVALLSTDGRGVRLDRSSTKRWTVVYAYPRTGHPAKETPHGWDQIPGARGCTPQTCAFRDLYAEFVARNIVLYGLSTQNTEYQREMVSRLNLPFAVLSDADLKITRALSLPTFEFQGVTLLKRFTLAIRAGTIRHVFYPVFPPDQNAREVLQWLRSCSWNTRF